MKQYSLRVIVKSDKQTVYGLTVPPYIADNFSGVSFFIKVSGDSLIFTSGCSTEEKKEQIPNKLHW